MKPVYFLGPDEAMADSGLQAREGGKMNDKCPFCGADKGANHYYKPLYYPKWVCGTWLQEDQGYSKYHRTSECYERQIATLQSCLEAAEAKLELWREFYKNLRYVDRASYEALGAFVKLKTAGEI